MRKRLLCFRYEVKRGIYCSHLHPAEQGDNEQLITHLEMRSFGTRFPLAIKRSLRTAERDPAGVQRRNSSFAQLSYPTAPDHETKQALLERRDRLADALARALEVQAVKKSWRIEALALGFKMWRTLLWGYAAISDQRIVPEKREIRCWNFGQLGHARSRCKKNMRPQPMSEN